MKDAYVDKRALVLRSFFRENGWVAKLPEDYMHYVEIMAKYINCSVAEPCYSLEECLKYHHTYEYELKDKRDGTQVCSVPAITSNGYFIIEGSEKVVIIQEVRLRTEMLIISNSYKRTGTVEHTRANFVNTSCELFIKGAQVPVRVQMVDNSVIELDTKSIHKNLNNTRCIGMFELLIYLFESDIEKISYITRSYCQASDASDGLSNVELTNACMVYIISSRRSGGAMPVSEYRKQIGFKMFGDMSDTRIIATLISMVVTCVKAKLLKFSSDRDDYSMKYLKTPGDTVCRIFKYCADICKNPKNMRKTIEQHIHTFIKRGDIVVGGKVYNKMSIQLSKRSDIDVLSCVRKVMIPCDENSPNIEMRQIHSSQLGFICPCETPDGKTVGITKSLASCCLISRPIDISGWIERTCEDKPFSGCMWVIVDGAVAGWCDKSVDTNELKKKHPTVSVVAKRNMVRVRTSGGRPLRPLVVSKDHPVDWDNVHIEYLDPAECAEGINVIASMDYSGNWKKYTHMEIHPCTMLGLAASLIPFPEHNQSARNVFASGMIKQSMQMRDSEKTCNTLQRPLVYTTIGREVGYDDSPNGINLVTCIMSINGFNQEDAIVFKKSAIDRGMFSSVVTYSTSVIVDNPWKILSRDRKVVILHGGTERKLTEIAPVESSILTSSKVTVHTTDFPAANGRTKIDVTMVMSRTLQVGDKLSSRHAQKGVVGLIMSEVDMPFNQDGIIPDIIINPHAIPSRMTVGQLLESVLGKNAAITHTFEDGTPFIRRGMKDINEILNMSDTETITLGTTGEVVHTPVAMGIVYYMALKHQSADKVYVRSSGPKSIMSRQPTSGRSKGGGLRFGEMEHDCLIAHGASELITEVAENSDMVDAPYCKICKIVTDKFDDICRLCGTKTIKKRVPFSYVVLKDMLLSTNIQLQTNFE